MYPHERSLVERLKDKPFTILGVNSDSSKRYKKAAIALRAARLLNGTISILIIMGREAACKLWIAQVEQTHCRAEKTHGSPKEIILTSKRRSRTIQAMARG